MSAWKVYWTDLREDKMCQTYPIWNYAVVVVSVTAFGMVCVSWILLHISFRYEYKLILPEIQKFCIDFSPDGTQE